MKCRYPADAFKVLVEHARLPPIEPFPAPCGGYADTYRAVCDWMGVQPREDVVSNCTITLPANGIREFDLADYDAQQMPLEELRALLTSLHYNAYFASLRAPKSWRLGERELQLVAELLRVNTHLQELRLAGSSREGLVLLAHAVRDNRRSAITVVDLGFSTCEDKGAAELGTALSVLAHGLVQLDPTRCEIGRVGVSGLCTALRKHNLLAATLSDLSLSGNRLEADGSAALAQFLSRPNSLRRLRLSYCAANLDQVLGALLMGSPDLALLHLAGNRITGRKEGTQLVKLLQSSSKLAELELGDTLVPVDVLREVRAHILSYYFHFFLCFFLSYSFLSSHPETYSYHFFFPDSRAQVLKAVFGNAYLRGLRLGLPGNKLGVVGANMIANIWAEGSNIEELNLSDNELGDEGMPEHVIRVRTESVYSQCVFV